MASLTSTVETRLLASTMANVPEWTLKGRFVKGVVLDAYDGDTIDLAIYLEESDQIVRTRARMYGYDAPERKPKRDVPNREEVIRKAMAARARLLELTSARVVYAELLGGDKYGRQLCNLFASAEEGGRNPENSINAQMIREGHGYAYYGGTKQAATVEE